MYTFAFILFFTNKKFSHSSFLSSGDSDESEDSSVVMSFKQSRPAPVGDGKDK